MTESNYTDEQIGQITEAIFPAMWPIFKYKRVNEGNVLIVQELVAQFGPPDVSSEDSFMIWLETAVRGGLNQ